MTGSPPVDRSPCCSKVQNFRARKESPKLLRFALFFPIADQRKLRASSFCNSESTGTALTRPTSTSGDSENTWFGSRKWTPRTFWDCPKISSPSLKRRSLGLRRNLRGSPTAFRGRFMRSLAVWRLSCRRLMFLN